MQQRKHSTTERDADYDTQISFRAPAKRKRRLEVFLARHGHSLQWFMNRAIEEKLAAAETEKN